VKKTDGHYPLTIVLLSTIRTKGALSLANDHLCTGLRRNFEQNDHLAKCVYGLSQLTPSELYTIYEVSDVN